jgi:hypothetical protein
MSERHLLVCMYWGMQACQSRRIVCEKCTAMIAIDPGNLVLLDKFQPVCAECFLRQNERKFGGALIAGVHVEPEPDSSVPPSLERCLQSVVRQYKRAIAIASN